MNKSLTLPNWLDSYVYETLGAIYCRQNSNMTVIDWEKPQILTYLGTYFPRSYVEARYIINTKILQKLDVHEDLSILDFGCGTGGEIIGLLTNIEKSLPKIKSINLTLIDGNQHALKLFEKILTEYKKRSRLDIKYQIAPILIADFYDLTLLDEIIKNKFDLIISFKAICEFVTKDKFDGNNPYKHIIQNYLPHLNTNGLIILVDVTTYNSVSKEWIPCMIDKGLKNIDCNIIDQNLGYSETFHIIHSRTENISDTSKVCWRIIKKDNN